MRFFLKLVLVWCMHSVMAGFLLPSLNAAEPDEQAVLAPVKAMFDGMTKRDPQSIKNPLLPGGTMVLMRDGKPIQLTFEPKSGSSLRTRTAGRQFRNPNRLACVASHGK
jgi:hypothetical protein